MKKIALSTLVTVVLCVGQAPIVRAETVTTTANPTTRVLITELQTGGASDATEEFVEIYNPNDETLNITGWQLQYRAASGLPTQTWPATSTKATVTCPAGSSADCTVTMQPKSRLVLVRTIANIAGALPMIGGFGDAGGEVRLVQPASQATPLTVHDFVGYGTALDAEGGHAAPAPAGGTSIKRKVQEDGAPVDTNNNATDFIANCGSPTPGIEDSAYIPLSTGCEAPPSSGTTADESGVTNTTEPSQETPAENENAGSDETAPTYLPLIVTEVLPNPASPQQDSTDEFIEIYNPNDTAVTLKDYRLQTGSDYRYTYTLGDTPLGPHMYLAITSAVSKLSLANSGSGSGVRLMGPNGTVAYEVANYGNAKEGQSWIQNDTGWQWTLTPTPGSANLLTLPAPKTTAAGTTTTTAKKKTTAAAAKVAAPKVTIPKAAAATKKAADTKTTTPVQQAAVAQVPQYWLLIPIGALAGGYAVYEYRQDIGRVLRKSWNNIAKNKVPLAEE